MDILTTIVGGLLAGLIIGPLARLVLPGRQNISMIVTVILGAIGAIVGGFIADYAGVGSTEGIDWIKHAIQIVAAAAVVLLYMQLFHHKQHT